MKSQNNLLISRLMSAVTIILGVMFLLYGILVEDEPTLVALLLITGGTVWYFMTQSRISSQNN